MAKFTHIHVHTQYSILDGACNIKNLVARAKELEMDSLAITDHGNMFGAKLFHQEANKAGIKPILGCEAYVARNGRFQKKERSDRSGYHLILLAKNEVGYHNLCILASYAFTEGLYYRPRIDWELIEKYHEGIICSSACIGGEIPKAIQRGDLAEAERVAQRFKDIFGEDFYLELQLLPTDNPKLQMEVYQVQQMVNKELLIIGKKLGIKCICSNDVHFIYEDDATAHDHLICVNTGKDLDDAERMRYTRSEFLKSVEQMEELFPNNPELLENTQEISNKVENYSLSHSAYMPNFPLPDDFEVDLSLFKEVLKRALEADMKSEKSEAKREEKSAQLSSCFAVIDKVTTVEELDRVVESGQMPSCFDLDSKYPISKQFLYLKYITFEGAHKRYGEILTSEQQERIDFELATIEKMGFPGYFLIVWDFIRAAREMGVSVGPGRGSAAGSVVAYCLAITNIDPLAYDLLFERFLNPERISMPDVDIDFDEDGREQVMHYVVEKYGRKRVAHIITFGTMAAKMAIRDVARVQKLPLPESNRLAKLIPDKPGTKFKDAFKDVAELAAERESPNPLIKTTLQVAEKLEGVVRQTGVHACGVIIAKDDLEKFIPVSTAKDAELFVVQYDGKHVEDVGLLKMDFLGLKTLSIIKDAVENIEISYNEQIDIDTIPLNDELTFELYSKGETTGLFQFESPGMKKYLRELKPNRFEDLIAMNALYRPGPMDYIPDFIARKHGIKAITYELEGMDEYLKDTYGITVYQEQVMLLSQKLAGFTKGQADTLRKAMGKKQIEVLNKLKGSFIDGAVERGHDLKTLEKVWGDWEKFASYAFNKSHSTCYAYVSYQTAYLKAHYPAQFMAALLSRNLSDIKKISFFMDECRRMGLSVKGPDVNHSFVKFSVDKQSNVRFGLGAIKGVGEAATLAIINERKDNGDYKDLYDFIERVNLQTVNKKTIENLIYAGAFDSLMDIAEFDISRGTFFTPDVKETLFLEHWVKYGNSFQKDNSTASNSLFGEMLGEIAIDKPKPTVVSSISDLELLNKERDLVGIYLSGHPLDNHKVVIDNFCNLQVEQLADLEAVRGKEFAICGMVTAVVNGTTKTGDGFGRITVEDFTGSFEFVFYKNDYEQFRNFCFEGYQLFIRGVVTQRWKDGPLSAKVTSIMSLREAKETLIKDVNIVVPLSVLSDELAEEIEIVVENNQGSVPLSVRFTDGNNGVALRLKSKSIKVNPSKELFTTIKNFGCEINCGKN